MFTLKVQKKGSENHNIMIFASDEIRKKIIKWLKYDLKYVQKYFLYYPVCSFMIQYEKEK